MADISKVKTPDGNTYNTKDSTARDHIANKSNPHGVTKAQIGLGNVDNTSDADKHVLANNIWWGGPVLNDTVSPIDAGLSSIHGANRLAFSNPIGITIEYSNDGGSTWNDYGASDREKVELVTSGGHGSSWFYIGKRSSKGTVTLNDKLRVTFNAYKCGVYTVGTRLLLNVSTQGASGSNVTLETSPHGDATTFFKVGTYPVSGCSGWNSIPINFRFGGGGSDAFRLTFGITGLSTNANYNNIFQVGAIFLYGTSAWVIPSNMAYNNHIYSFNYKQDAIFPAQITATKFNGPATTADSATKATQDASGNVITSTYATKSELSSHSQNTSNPHKVTASQIGALPLSGGSLTGKLTVPSIETGSADTNYFQTQKMRGEGDANTYYHAIDFGYANHDQVDFYEYGGKYVFHQHTQAAKSSGDTVIGEINSNGFVGKVNGHTINADVPTGAKFTDTTYSNATISAAGLMSSADKAKLDGIAAGAEKNAITGVKGDSESSYRTGNVNITKENIGLSNVDNTADNQKAVKSAASATKDSQGQQINTTYIKELSALGRTITAVKGNGASSIFNIAGDDLYLFYRGVAIGDLNEITTTGIYYVMSGGLANNGPSNIDITYCYLIIIGFAALKQQFILKPDSGMILMRSYLGQHTALSQDDNLLDENSQPVLDESGNVVTATFKTPPEIASNSKAVWSRWYKINGIGV